MSIEFADVPEKEVLDGTELILGASLSAQNAPEKYRLPYNGQENVVDHGAVGDGVTDDTDAINEAIAAAVISGKEVYFPHAGNAEENGYVVTDTIQFPNGMAVFMVGKAIKLTAGGPILRHGTGESTNVLRGKRCRLQAIYLIPASGSGDWSEGNYCVEMVGGYQADLEIPLTVGGRSGLRITTTPNSPFGYNRITCGRLHSHKKAIDIFLTADGWCNANNFYMSSINVPLNVKPGEGRYGIYIDDDDSLIINECNGNNMYGVSIELSAPGGEEQYPFWLKNCAGWRFWGCRIEACDPTYVARLSGILATRDNIIDIGYLFAAGDLLDIDPSIRRHIPARVSSMNYPMELAWKTVWESKYLPTAYGEEDDGDHIINDMSWLHVFSGDPHFSSPINDFDPEWIQIGTGRGITKKVNFTQYDKARVLRVTTQSPTTIEIESEDVPETGILAIVCFDESGTQITTDSTPPPVHYGNHTANFGGSYQLVTHTSETIDLYFRGQNTEGEPEVGSCYLVWFSTTLLCKISNLRIETPTSTSVTVTTITNPEVWSNTPNRLSAQVPTTGLYNTNDVIYALDPNALGSIGWICTAGGTPGTWITFGPIEGTYAPPA